jgi:RepB DNA-primase from phage plasmid
MTETSPFRPRLLSAPEYVLALHRPEDRVAVLVRSHARGQTMQRILAAEDVASPPFQAWLSQTSQSDADIFLGMNPLRHNSCARTKECILEIRHVYLDLDENGPASLHAIRTTGDVPVPNFVLDTSPEKNQVVWRVDGLERDHAESLLRSLATQFRGDPAATDISRVLRVPGFRNWKYNEPFQVRAIQETDQVYQLRDFVVHEDSPDRGRDLNETREPARRTPPAHRSQSEADWAYAKRALARGDDPEEVIRRIADYRAQDKADPNYYARHTVTKAEADLQRGTRAPRTNDSRGIESHHLDENQRQMP